MALSIVLQGKKLLAHKKYHEVVRLLEPHVLEYRDSFAFHFYVGLAYLNLGEMASAKDYFSTAKKLKPNDPDLMAAIAAMSLRRQDTGKAVEYYLRILDIRPSYELAKKGLSCIRKYNSAEDLGDFIRTGKIKALYPKPNIMEFYVRYVKLAIVLFCFAIVLGVSIPFLMSKFKVQKREDITSLALDSTEKKKAIDMEGVFRDVLTHSDVILAYNKAQDYFQNFQDNLAQVEINKILNSNATFSIQQKALNLQSRLKEPRFDEIKDIFSYSEVEKKSYLYNGCYVIWKGMPTNVQKTAESTSFDLLVGYDTKTSLEGTVSVFCNFVSNIDVEKAISVLAQIKILENDKITLRGITIHQSAKPLDTN